MNWLIRLFSSILLLYAIQQTVADDEKEKFKLVMDKLEKVAEAEEIVKTDISLDTEGDEVTINGVFDQLVELNDDYKVSIEVFHSAEENGEFKRLLGKYDMDFCEVMKKQYKNYFYETLKNYSNAPHPDECPLSKRTYEVKGYPLDSEKFKHFLRPGFYKINGHLSHGDKEVLKYIMEAHTEPE